jgi:S-adenosylmethionine synthetase
LKDADVALCPDGKVLLVLAQGQQAWRVKSVSLSLLPRTGISDLELQRVALSVIQEFLVEARKQLPLLSDALPEHIVVNGGGTFAIGGPEGDNGLSGKKLLLDYYGPRVVTGGSALSGKDLHKPDRAGAHIARQVALAVVRAGIAPEATVHCVSFPGDEAPRIQRIETPLGDISRPDRWAKILDTSFKSQQERLRRRDLVEQSRWGHFGEGE